MLKHILSVFSLRMLLFLSSGTFIFEGSSGKKISVEFYHKHSFMETMCSTRNEKNRRTVSLARYITEYLDLPRQHRHREI